MLLVRQIPHELLDIDGDTLAVEVALGMNATDIDEHVGIGDNARHGDEHVIVHLVKFATLTSGHKERRCFLLLSSKDHT